jgi:uncharacterized protein (DUF983 family)
MQRVSREQGVLLGRLALVAGACLLGVAGVFSLVLGGCGWTTGEQFCGGDVDALLEGYVAGVVMTAAAPMLAVRAVTPRWAIVLLVGLLTVVGSVVYVLHTEGVV